MEMLTDLVIGMQCSMGSGSNTTPYHNYLTQRSMHQSTLGVPSYYPIIILSFSCWLAVKKKFLSGLVTNLTTKSYLSASCEWE